MADSRILLPSFRTFIQPPEPLRLGNAFFVAVGDCEGLALPRRPDMHVTGQALAGKGPQALSEALFSLDPTPLARGVAILVDPKAQAEHPLGVYEVQRALACLFVKFVLYPLRSGKIPDRLGVRAAPIPDYTQEHNRVRNLPLTLTRPLADRLKRLAPSPPLLVCLPGPSLTTIAAELADMAQRCLVVAVARSLPFLAARNVWPDFVVQLDASPRQVPFHIQSGTRGRATSTRDAAFGLLSKSCLVAHSASPAHGLAEHYGRVVFMDSFDKNALPNDFRLRESWLSVLMPCLGLAEILAAPQLVLAGGDLCFPLAAEPGQAGAYAASREDGEHRENREKREHEEHPDGLEAALAATGPVPVGDAPFALPDVHGSPVRTSLAYFAASCEAERFAREIAASAGVSCFTATRPTLLSEETFPPVGVRWRTWPQINRQLFHARLADAVAEPPRVDLAVVRGRLETQLMHLDPILAVLAEEAAEDPQEAIGSRPAMPFLSAVDGLGSDVPRLADKAARLATAKGCIERWREDLTLALAFLKLHEHYGAAKAISVLCLPEEGDAAALRVLRRHPWLRVTTVHILADPALPKPDSSTGPSGAAKRWLAFTDLADWLREETMVLATDAALKEFAFVLDILPERTKLMPLSTRMF